MGAMKNVMAPVIPEQLTTPSEAEVFYKNYYDAQKTPRALQHFLTQATIATAIQKGYILPDVPETVPQKLSENMYFGSDRKRTVFIKKHEWYTPEYYHNHEFIELFYVLSGSCKQRISNGQFEMKTGDLCIIPPNISHSIGVFDSSIIIDILIRQSTFEDIFYNLLRENNILSSFFLSNLYGTKASDYLIFHTGCNEQIRQQIITLYLESQNKDNYVQDLLQSEFQILLISTLRYFGTAYELPPGVNKDNVLRFDIICYIRDNYRTVTLEDAARKYGFMPENASKVIKHITGYTFTQLLQNIKMQKTCSLLTETDMPIEEIAYEVGYQTPRHFIRLFKSLYKMTPSEYRKKNISLKE